MKKRMIIGIALFFIGLILAASSSSITGNVIGKSAPSSIISMIGIALCLGSLILMAGDRLEHKLYGKKDIHLEKRKDGYYIVRNKNNEAYSLNDIKELSKDNDLKKDLRSYFFSDLLTEYAKSDDKKIEYRKFIEAMSPDTNPHHLDRRLKKYEEVYNRLKKKKEDMDPERAKKARPEDFSQTRYVRFENEKDTLWPEEGSIGFLPFDEIKVNPARGPIFSVITLKKLNDDDFLKLSPKEKQEYLKGEFGIDVGARQRTMIIFEIEKDAILQKYGNYDNIEIKGKVPLVKVIKKK